MIVLNKTLFLKTIEINILWFTHKKNIQYVDEYIKQFESTVDENFDENGDKEFKDLGRLYQYVTNKVVENEDLKDIIDPNKLIDNVINELGEKYQYDG
jgi:flagellin-specific chaperone FliS